MTAMDTTSVEATTGPALGLVERHAVDRPFLNSGGGIPAVRELERTLYYLLALAAVVIATAALSQHTIASTVAVTIGGLLCALAVAILRAITKLTPPFMRQPLTSRARPVRVAVVGATASAVALEDDLRRTGVATIDVIGAIAPDRAAATDTVQLGGLADVGRLVAAHRLDVLLVGWDVSRTRVAQAVIGGCEGAPVRVFDLSAFYEELYGHVPITKVDESWMQCVLHPRFRERRSQRVADVVVAGGVAAVVLPLLLVVGLLIRRDGGPALFRQERIGRDGRRFVIYKLRSMRWHAGEEPARWAEDGDPRITPLGHILRRSHLDELPQLLNVLRGDMTLVGPRPEQPEIVERIEETLPLWRGRHRYKPGLTGWAQVRCGYAGSHDGSARKLAHDLYYLRHQSLVLDAAILAQTVAMVLFGRRFERRAPFALRPHESKTVLQRDAVGARRARPARFVRAADGARRALVTGGAGFIGSQLVDRLIEDGYDVLAVDDLSAGAWENLAPALDGGARLEVADVTAADEMRRLFMAARPDVVFHLAAQIQVSRAVEEPLLDATANVVGTLSVLEATRACRAGRFVFASSGGAIYGDATIMPTPEDAPLAPLSPYGAAKLAAEQYTALYGVLYGLSTATLRLANVYGPRQGFSGEGGVIARFCRARVDGVPAEVFGDGRQTRDYVHVADVVAAFAAAGRSSVTGAFNIGTGTETSLLGLLETLGLRAEFRPARNGDVRRSVLDASAALRQLDWRAQTPMAEGLQQTLAFADGLRARSRVAV